MQKLFYLFSKSSIDLNVYKIGFKVKRKVLLFICLFPFLMQFSCSTTEPPPPDETKPTLTLNLDDVSCIEAWLQLKTKDLELPAELTLKQYNPTGDSIAHIYVLNTQDSLLYIDSLHPNQSYSFQVSSIQHQVSSIKQAVTTMDTTSHNFTFQSWTFGTIGSSSLYDVAVINENNIWAVGEIIIADTSINGYTVYNAVHWNGTDWELLRIPYYYNGQTFYNGIRAIFAFNENDIWFGIASLIHWNGTVYQSINTSLFFPAMVNKMWGTSSNNFYIVGTNGQIARYNGTSWQSIESGTTLNINDIWGDFNEKTQEWEILAVASNFGTSLEKEILQIKNNATFKLPLSPQMWPLKTVWFIPNKQYYVAGAGVYQKKLLTDGLWRNQALEITTFSTYSIKGNNINDVVGVGTYGDFIHFNGKSWKSFQSISAGYLLFQARMRFDQVVAVGTDGANGYIIKGMR